MTAIALFLILAVAAAMVFVRLTPVADTAIRSLPDLQPVGDYPFEGGFYAVRPLTGVPEEVLGRLDQIIMDEPRITRRSGTPDAPPMVYETRSAVWAFPDINTVWIADGNLHVHAHLVYGRKDFGANQRRVLGWLERL